MKLIDIPFEKSCNFGITYYKYSKHTPKQVIDYLWDPDVKILRVYFSRYDFRGGFFKQRTLHLPPVYLTYMLLKYP